MSKERALLRRVKVLLECSNMEPLQRQADLIIGEIRELLAQPEQEPKTRHALDSYWNQEAYQRGYAEAELKLKREPLSDEAVCQILLKKEWRGFVDLVRIIEKMHGIGGEI